MSFDIPGGFISVLSPVYPPTAMPSLPPQEVFRSSTPASAPMMLHAHTYPMAHEHRMPQHIQHSCSFPQCEAEYGERDIRPVTPGAHKNAHGGPYVYPQTHDSEKTLAPSDVEDIYYNEPIIEQNQNSPSFESYSPTTPPLLLYAQLSGQHQAKTHGFRAGVRRGLEKAHIHVHKKSIGEALAHNAGLAAAIPVPTGVVGSTPSLDSSYSQPRSSPNVTSSALKPNYKKRPDPNYCRMRDCGKPVARIASLGGYIEWCGCEHMKEGMQRYGLKACKKCRTNPRRWDDRYCCPACER